MSKQKIFKQLRSQYRLSLLKESSYEERLSLLLTPLNIILLLSFTFLIVGGIVYIVVALTPLREVLVPGYVDEQYRNDAQSARQQADSAMIQLAIYSDYLDVVSNVMKGNIHPDSVEFDSKSIVDESLLSYEISEEDSLLRTKIEEEDRFALNLAGAGDEKSTSRKFLFKPLEGTLSAGFDPDNDHYGIDLVAPQESVIKSVLDGTVILSSYTSDGGHVIQVQHSNNLVSVYKHNSVLLKKTGNRVRAGESIAVIGDTGDHSDGPHLHFELWENGSPINPSDYFSFEE